MVLMRALVASTSGNAPLSSTDGETTMIPLPDIKEVLKKKELEEELARIEEEQAETKVKIKRSDRKALAKVRFHTSFLFFVLGEFSTFSTVTSVTKIGDFLAVRATALCRCR
jgi:hypothetical protein